MWFKTISLKPFFYTLSLFLLITTTIYYYPRYLIKSFGENSPWIGYLYTYGIGGLFFILSVSWIFTRKKTPLRRREEFFWLIVILLGLIFSFCMHGLWILFALSFPTKF